MAELNRDSINKLEEAFADAKNDQKFIMSDSDRVGNVLLGLHQGATGIITLQYLLDLYGLLFTSTILQGYCNE